MNSDYKRFRVGCLLLAMIAIAIASPSADAANTVVKFDTILGDAYVRLLDTDTPVTTENFLLYVNGQSFDDTVFHRLVRGFILQGGSHGANAIPNHGQIVNEYGRSNVRGTIAMAKVAPEHGGGPDSATSGFFFNLSNTNAANLDNQNGGFTVFGYVIDGGMFVIDALADGVQYSNFLIDTGDPNNPNDSRYAGEWPRIVPLDANGDQLDAQGQEIWYYEWINSVTVHNTDGDINFDGVVDDVDYALFVASFGEQGLGLPADFDGDYDVDLADFAVLRENYNGGASSPLAAPGATVPEPTSMCLLGLCAAAMIRKRRKAS